MELNKVTQKELYKALEISLKADTPTIVTSSAGLGKSAIVKQLAEDYNLKLIDIRLSQITQFDLIGFPKAIDNKMRYMPMEGIPLEDDPLPINPETNEEYDGFLLFFDELNSADKYVQGACYRLILDREVGLHKVHPKCRMLAAGNRIQDKALVNTMVTPLVSRFTHLEMYVDKEEFFNFMEEQTIQNKWNSLVLSFIRFKPEYINNFNPDLDVQPFSCPRTLEMVCKQLDAGLLDLPHKLRMNILIGIIGKEAGIDLGNFLDIMKDLPTLEEIIMNPLEARMPMEVGAKWALGGYLFNHISKKNAEPIVDYLSRIPEADIRMMIYKLLVKKSNDLLTNAKILKDLKEINQKISSL